MHLADSSNHMTAIDWLVVAASQVLGTSFFGFLVFQTRQDRAGLSGCGTKAKMVADRDRCTADSVDAGELHCNRRHGLSQGFHRFGLHLDRNGLRDLPPGPLPRSHALPQRRADQRRIFGRFALPHPCELPRFLIQILYRFIALALVGYALATMFRVVMGVEMTYYGIFISMTPPMLYVHASGQLGVVMAAIPQVGLMLLVSGIVFYSVFSDLGGVQGIQRQPS